MKKEFTDFVRLLGGTTRYSGGTEKPELTEKTQHAKTVISGRHKLGKGRYQRKLIAVGYYAGKQLIAMRPSEGRIMYVHGLKEDQAVKLHDKYKDTTLPFNVVFQ
jgi:hypothetical protein